MHIIVIATLSLWGSRGYKYMEETYHVVGQVGMGKGMDLGEKWLLKLLNGIKDSLRWGWFEEKR